MGTTATTTPRRGPRVRGSAPDRDDATSREEQQYDLLTAALLGLAVGVGTTLLLRRGPGGRRPAVQFVRGAAEAGRTSGRWMGEQGREMWDRSKGRGATERKLRRYLRRAQRRIDDAVSAEVASLRRAVRKQRKRVGL